MLEREFEPEIVNVSNYTDFVEFQKLRNSIKNSHDLDFNNRSNMLELLGVVFQSSDGLQQVNPIFSSKINNDSELEEWKDKHLGKYKDQVELDYSEDKLLLMMNHFGIVLIDHNASFKVDLIRAVYPNNITVLNTYDAGDFYLKECD